MTCSACSFDNDRQAAFCSSCGAGLTVYAGLVAHHAPSNGLSFEARIADAETRLAALTQHIAEIEAERAAIAEALALARGSNAAIRRPAGESTALTAPPHEPQLPVRHVGTFRVTFGGPHGTCVASTGRAGGVTPPFRLVETRWNLPPFDARPSASTAVWDAFARGARVVRIDSPGGAGATTLLHLLGAGARDHGCPDGALFLTDVRGPALDIGQRLAALTAAGEVPRYETAADLRRDFGGVGILALLDRARLTAADQAQLVDLFPSFRFVIVDSLAVGQTPMIELGPLDGQAAIALVESACRRSIEGDERTAALELCSSFGLSPGGARLIGAAGAGLRRSFVALRAHYGDRGGAGRALLASLPPDAHAILEALAFMRGPLRRDSLEKIVGAGDLRAHLQRLHDSELVESAGPDAYRLPGYLETLVPAFNDGEADAAFGRLAEVLRDAFDPNSHLPVLDEELIAAEPLVQRAFERSRWPQVLELGPRLAEMFAMRGAFGAWGRVLNLVAAAAKRIDDVPQLSLVRHELGVRALLEGEYHKATTSLRAAARERERTGDADGAAASGAALALVTGALADSDHSLDPAPSRSAFAPSATAFAPSAEHLAIPTFAPSSDAPSRNAPDGLRSSGDARDALGRPDAHQTRTARVAIDAIDAIDAIEASASSDASDAVDANHAADAVDAHHSAEAVGADSAADAADRTAGDRGATDPIASNKNRNENNMDVRKRAGPQLARRGGPHVPRAAPRRSRSAHETKANRRGFGPATATRTVLLGLTALVIALFAVVWWPHPRRPATAQIAEFSADRKAVNADADVHLCVRAAGAALLEIQPDVGLLPAGDRRCVTVRPRTTTTYTAIATAPGGQTLRSTPLTVEVREAAAGQGRLQIVDFSANPARIRAGETTRLCYAVTGASILRIVPRVGDIVQLRSCRDIALTEPHSYTYKLLAIGDNGQIAVRQARIEVTAAPSVTPAAAPAETPRQTAAPIARASTSPAAASTPKADPARAQARPEASTRIAAANPLPTPGGWLARKAVYQFDVTPAVIERGQTASLCAGVGVWARGNVTGIGTLHPGITRCYRVHPTTTTVYRLHVALDSSVAEETVTVAVQTPPGRRHDVAHAPRK